jgi:hypothetical protein
MEDRKGAKKIAEAYHTKDGAKGLGNNDNNIDND